MNQDHVNNTNLSLRESDKDSGDYESQGYSGWNWFEASAFFNKHRLVYTCSLLVLRLKFGKSWSYGKISAQSGSLVIINHNTALGGFHACSLSWSSWNFENPHMSPGRNRTQATGQRGERHPNCTIPVPQTNYLQCIFKIQRVAVWIISAWLVS